MIPISVIQKRKINTVFLLFFFYTALMLLASIHPFTLEGEYRLVFCCVMELPACSVAGYPVKMASLHSVQHFTMAVLLCIRRDEYRSMKFQTNCRFML
jgi:hypothetical protein